MTTYIAAPLKVGSGNPRRVVVPIVEPSIVVETPAPTASMVEIRGSGRTGGLSSSEVPVVIMRVPVEWNVHRVVLLLVSVRVRMSVVWCVESPHRRCTIEASATHFKIGEEMTSEMVYHQHNLTLVCVDNCVVLNFPGWSAICARKTSLRLPTRTASVT